MTTPTQPNTNPTPTENHTMSKNTTTTPKPFDLGRVVSTPGAMETFPRPVMLEALGRHLAHDWSEMDPEDQETNAQATHSGARILSSFTYNGDRLWIITDGDDDQGFRHCTTFLLPSEY